MMIRTITQVVWVFWLWGSGIAVFGQTHYPGEQFFRFLPEENTIAVILMPDLPGTLQHLEYTPVIRHLLVSSRGEENVPFQHPLSQWMATITDQTGIPLTGWRNLAQHAVAFAVLSEEGPDDDAATALISPELALFIDIEDEERFLTVLLDDIFLTLQSQEPDTELGIFQFQGETLHQITNQHFQAYYAIIDHTFLAAMNRDLLQRLVQEFKNDNVSSAAHAFAEAFRAATDADVHVAVQLPTLWPHIRSKLIDTCASMPGIEMNLLLSFLENYQWPFATWNLTLHQESISERLHIIYPSTATSSPPMSPYRTGDPPVSHYHNRRFVSDRLISDQILYYGARHVNVSAWWQDVQSFLHMAAAEAGRVNEFESWLIRLETLFQKPLNTLLSELGDIEIAGAWYPPEFVQRSRRIASLAQIPLVLMLHADARHELERALQHLLTALGVPQSRSSFQEREIVTCQVPFYGKTMVIFYAIVDDVFLLSGSEALIKESIRRARYGRSLSEHEEYRAGFASFPSQSLTRGYLSLSASAKLLNASWNRQAALSQRALLPVLADMMLQWPPMIWVTTVEPHGFLTTSESPLGGPIAGLLAIWAAFSWMP